MKQDQKLTVPPTGAHGDLIDVTDLLKTVAYDNPAAKKVFVSLAHWTACFADIEALGQHLLANVHTTVCNALLAGTSPRALGETSVVLTPVTA